MVLVAEAAMLGLLVWALLFSSAVSTSGTFGLGSILVGAVTLTAVLIAITTAVVMLVRAMAANREIRRAPSIAAWTQRWHQAISDPAACPAPPYTEDAIEALLEVRESVDASEARRAAEIVIASGADRVLMERRTTSSRSPGTGGPPGCGGGPTSSAGRSTRSTTSPAPVSPRR